MDKSQTHIKKGLPAYLEHSATGLARLPRVQLYASSAGFTTLSMQKVGKQGQNPGLDEPGSENPVDEDGRACVIRSGSR
ncbi:hypothetical protein PpBr36_07190 [Pyricularia pennisetigena]|uniref:hypothetical protein n=1 Tax=Pyricularia pennisetigena TaxID=1578925 RepID=UPI00114E8845|nr:hypothetical protein PpBr36_07190 [Pyricularia pennisetigena]TLS25389.1 hypothetical protein PpBr36_07190 [Pyricularia pennisetigena]